MFIIKHICINLLDVVENPCDFLLCCVSSSNKILFMPMVLVQKSQRCIVISKPEHNETIHTCFHATGGKPT